MITYGAYGAGSWRIRSGTPIGEMTFVKVRDFTSDPAWEAADAHDGDIEKIVSVCTDPAYAMIRARRPDHAVPSDVR